MKISLIRNLFAFNVDAVSNSSRSDNASQADVEEARRASSRRSDDAVIYAKTFTATRQATNAMDEARVARIQRIKEQLKTGEYRPDLDKVAQAVLQGLS